MISISSTVDKWQLEFETHIFVRQLTDISYKYNVSPRQLLDSIEASLRGHGDRPHLTNLYPVQATNDRVARPAINTPLEKCLERLEQMELEMI
jgi:hypothetical protein